MDRPYRKNILPNSFFFFSNAFASNESCQTTYHGNNFPVNAKPETRSYGVDSRG